MIITEKRKKKKIKLHKQIETLMQLLKKNNEY